MNEGENVPIGARKIGRLIGGKAGEALGEGYRKTVYNLDFDRAIVSVKEKHAPKEKPAEYFKAQYYPRSAWVYDPAEI